MDPATSITILAILVTSLLSVKLNVLDRLGALAASMIGIIVLVSGGWKLFALLLLFLVMASAATKVGKRRKALLFAWEPLRGWKSVVANGAIAASLAVAEGLASLEAVVAGFVGAVATSASDTLATEIGLLSPQKPRLLINPRKQVQPGTSGAISPLGEAAMLASSIAIGAGAWLLGIHSWSLNKALMIGVIAGVAGCTFDSLLGCTIQGEYRCQRCGKLTEEPWHCGIRAKLIKGNPLVTNHVVNFLSTALGAASAIAVCLLARIA